MLSLEAIGSVQTVHASTSSTFSDSSALAVAAIVACCGSVRRSVSLAAASAAFLAFASSAALFACACSAAWRSAASRAASSSAWLEGLRRSAAKRPQAQAGQRLLSVRVDEYADERGRRALVRANHKPFWIRSCCGFLIRPSSRAWTAALIELRFELESGRPKHIRSDPC